MIALPPFPNFAETAKRPPVSVPELRTLPAPTPRVPDPHAWTLANKALAGTAALGMLGDYLTTVDYIRRRSHQMEETNMILGKHPSVGNLNAYMGAATIGSALLASRLPSDWRNMFLGGLSALELAIVSQNRAAGLRFNFNF